MKLVSIKELYYDARPTNSQHSTCFGRSLHPSSGV